MALLESINTLTIVCHFIRSGKLEKTQAAKNKAKNEVLQATKILQEVGGSPAKLIGLAFLFLFFEAQEKRRELGKFWSFRYLFVACGSRQRWLKQRWLKTKLTQDKVHG
eukprot:gene15154-16712_t